MTRPFSLLAALALLAAAALGAYQALIGVDLTLAGRPVSDAAYWGFTALALVLAFGLLLERTRHGSGVARESGGRNDGDREAVMVDGKLVPAAYFLFASDVLSPDAIGKVKTKYGRVLIGFDAGNVPETGPIDLQSFRVARDLGAELEIYVEGPGGPTGDSGWLKDEAARVKKASEGLGIDTTKKGWRDKEWDTWGWKKYTFAQLARYKAQGFNAGEIDNISRVLEGSDKLLALYKEYAVEYAKGTMPQLVMKNISVEDMSAIVRAIETNVLPRSMFSEFHIFELDPGDSSWRMVDAISKRVGIRTVPSTNTYQYDAKGEFGLEAEFDAAMASATKPLPSSQTVMAGGIHPDSTV